MLLLAIPWIVDPLSNGYGCMLPGVDDWVLIYEVWYIRTQWIYIFVLIFVLVQVVGCTALSAAFMSISFLAGLFTNITFRHNLASVEYPAGCDECWGSIYTLDAIYIAWPAIAGVLLFFDSSASCGAGGENEPLISYN